MGEERRMKKFWIVLLSLLLSLGCVFGFAACDETPPDDETGGTVQPGGPGKPHEHDFGEWTVTISATCTEEGEEQRTCSCGETETRPIAAKGHTEAIDAAVAPTCTETGLTEGKHCSVCNEVLVEQEVLQTIPHNYVDGVCTRCEDTIAATDDSYFIFTELEDGTYSVAWDRNTDLPAEVVIPREYNGKSVTQIGENAFEYCESLTNVSIPSSVTSIGDYAFYFCINLTSITIPEGVTSIECFVFGGCDSLTSITIPSSVTSIGEQAFTCGFSLTRIIVSAENPVYHSEGNCLIETESKTLVVGCENSIIPDNGSVNSIGDWAFVGYRGLTSITIPDSVNSIGDWTFAYCGLTSIIIPDSVNSIGDYAFWYCDSLASITIPDSVTSIGEQAFNGCDGIIEEENDVYYVNRWVVDCSEDATNVSLRSDTIGIADSAFRECDSPTSIIIPDSVTSIGEMAFFGCSSLTSITIPDGVTSIGEWSFYCCESLTSVTIPDSVTSIGNGAFSGCDSLTSITIPDSVTFIGEQAFNGCESLTSITIPVSVTSIGSHAFYSCDSLASATFINPNGWSADSAALSAEDLSDPATAAKYLRSTYRYYTWTRE